MYSGDVNLVIKDYLVEQPSSQSISPKPPKPQANAPKVIVKPVQPIQPKQEENVEQKQEPAQSKPNVKPVQPIMPDQNKAPSQSQPQPQQQPQNENKPTQKPNPKPAPKENEKPKLKAVQPIMPDQSAPKQSVPTPQTKPKPKPKPKPLEMLFNLRSLRSADIRQLLLNIGEPMIGEIMFSNSITGEQFYHYIVVNPLLKQFNVSFADEPSYSILVHQVELSYKKNGAVDIHNRPSLETKEETKAETKEEKCSDMSDNNESLKQNIANLISSDVRLLILPYNPELAERLYAYSINGNDLQKYDYDGVCFATGMKTLSKENWNTIVSELKLAQSEPFDASKWNQLKTNQEAVIRQARNMDKQIKTIIQSTKQNAKPQSQPQPHPHPPTRPKQAKRQQKQLARIVSMEKETDKFLPSNLQKLKSRQMNTLTTLHDIASIIGLDANIVNNIQQSARRQSERDLQNYLKRGNAALPLENKENINISAQELEKRQLELLSTINNTRKRLEILAASKGVNLDALSNIKCKINVADNESLDIIALNKQFDNLFNNLSSVAMSVQTTAKKYGVELDNNEINKYILPMYNDLETKQNELIARIEYLNGRARMINPKAVQVNEQILHITSHAHRRTSSGPFHLSVPMSPGDSPTPQDHFPDNTETKLEYDHLSQHPSGLPVSNKHSRSPSLSAGITITSPVETEREATQVRKRRKSLQINSALLSKVLNEFDKENSGYLSKDMFVGALNKININMDDNDLKILNDICDKKGVNIVKVLSLVEEQHLTLKLNTSKQWNSFRMKIISVKK